MSSSSFLIHSQSFRTNIKSDSFSELILLSYCCLIIQYMKLLFENTFVIFDRFIMGQSLCSSKLKTIQEIKFLHRA